MNIQGAGSPLALCANLLMGRAVPVEDGEAPIAEAGFAAKKPPHP
jgi:hypothetical protein